MILPAPQRQQAPHDQHGRRPAAYRDEQIDPRLPRVPHLRPRAVAVQLGVAHPASAELERPRLTAPAPRPRSVDDPAPRCLAHDHRRAHQSDPGQRRPVSQHPHARMVASRGQTFNRPRGVRPLRLTRDQRLRYLALIGVAVATRRNGWAVMA